MFFCPLSILITLLGEEGAGLCAYRAFVCLLAMHTFICITSLVLLVSGLGCGLCLWLFLGISIYLFSRPMSKSVIISCQFYMNVFTIDVIVNFNETKRKEEEINFPF